jgi:hypothetical protein
MKNYYTKSYFHEIRQREGENNMNDLIYRNREGTELMFFGTLHYTDEGILFVVFNNEDDTKHETIEVMGKYDFQADLEEIRPVNHLVHWAFLRHMEINKVFTFRLSDESHNAPECSLQGKL